MTSLEALEAQALGNLGGCGGFDNLRECCEEELDECLFDDQELDLAPVVQQPSSTVSIPKKKRKKKRMKKKMSSHPEATVEAFDDMTRCTVPDVAGMRVVRLPAFTFVHVLDVFANVSRVEVGPQTLTVLENEKVVVGPVRMVALPPMHYAVINNPVLREEGVVVRDKSGQAQLRHGDREIRFHQPPFALYPGEVLACNRPISLRVIEDDSALRLRATRDFIDTTGVGVRKDQEEEDGKEKEEEAKEIAIPRKTGDEWMFYGPAPYVPQVEVDIVEEINAIVLEPNQALHLRARRDCVDVDGTQRTCGEEWLVLRPGAYLPGVDEEIVGVENAITLSRRQYCVILDPVADDGGANQYGQRKLVRGEAYFFLKPGERLDRDLIDDVYLLEENEGLIMRGLEEFQDENGRIRQAGSRWLVCGPRDYVPPLEAEVVERRKALIHIESWAWSLLFWRKDGHRRR